MKPHAAWFELSVVGGGLLVVMLVAMWAQRPDADCTLTLEAPRVLVLSRETDREHLTTDLAAGARTARRYMLASVVPAEQHNRFAACEAMLVEQIATRHSLSPELVRARLTNP